MLEFSYVGWCLMLILAWPAVVQLVFEPAHEITVLITQATSEN